MKKKITTKKVQKSVILGADKKKKPSILKQIVKDLKTKIKL